MVIGCIAIGDGVSVWTEHAAYSFRTNRLGALRPPIEKLVRDILARRE